MPVALTDVAPLGGRLLAFFSDARVPHEARQRHRGRCGRLTLQWSTNLSCCAFTSLRAALIEVRRRCAPQVLPAHCDRYALTVWCARARAVLCSRFSSCSGRSLTPGRARPPSASARSPRPLPLCHRRYYAQEELLAARSAPPGGQAPGALEDRIAKEMSQLQVGLGYAVGDVLPPFQSSFPSLTHKRGWLVWRAVCLAELSQGQVALSVTRGAFLRRRSTAAPRMS